MGICRDCVGDIMAKLPWFLCWLFFGYMLVMWCILLIDLDMFWWTYEWLMNTWNKKYYCSYYERELDLFGDSHIIFKLLWLDMHSWPIAYIFSICLKKWLSWLCLVRSGSCSSFLCLALSLYHLSFWEVLGSFGQWFGGYPGIMAQIMGPHAMNWEIWVTDTLRKCCECGWRPSTTPRPSKSCGWEPRWVKRSPNLGFSHLGWFFGPWVSYKPWVMSVSCQLSTSLS